MTENTFSGAGGGETRIEVRLINESVRLTADQVAELFQRDRSGILARPV